MLIVTQGQDKVLGPRFIRLLEEIRERGSIRAASSSLGIGYRHALAWIKRAELLLGRPLVDRRTGGAAGGGAGVTPEGVRLVRAYRRVSSSIGRVVERAESEILGS